MDIEHAKELLLILSDGINPLTGEILPDEDSCNQVEIVRALNTVIRALDAQQANKKKPKPTNSSSHENAGKPWTEADDNALCRMFDAGYSKKKFANISNDLLAPLPPDSSDWGKSKKELNLEPKNKQCPHYLTRQWGHTHFSAAIPQIPHLNCV